MNPYLMDARHFIGDIIADVGLWMLRRASPWKDNHLAARINDVAELYDTRPRDPLCPCRDCPCRYRLPKDDHENAY